jgi:hypothetical protein
MQLTLEEQEREAYRDGNTDLANAIGKAIDLENQASDLRAVIRDAADLIDEKTDQHVSWHERAAAALDED